LYIRYGTLVDVDEWGARKLAYEINYETDGYYVVYSFDSKPDFPMEFERIINITDAFTASSPFLSENTTTASYFSLSFAIIKHLLVDIKPVLLLQADIPCGYTFCTSL